MFIIPIHLHARAVAVRVLAYRSPIIKCVPCRSTPVSFTSKECTLSFDAPDANDLAKHEQVIGALTDRTGVPLAEVRALYAGELARLARGATVRSYLALRTTSNVLAMLRGRRDRA